jgi:16S rRNA (uracil1498-N3)-methyltransferase
MHRFFVDSIHKAGSPITLPFDISRQIATVLRLNPGVSVLLLDNSGFEYTVSLTTIDKSQCEGFVTAENQNQNEAKTAVTLMLALTQREKFEWILQKGTEIGIKGFQPLITSRSLVQKTAEVEGKFPRWQKIIKEAAEQSGRGVLPKLYNPVSLTNLLKNPLQSEMNIILWEDEHNKQLKQLIRGTNTISVSLIIGPEGGLTNEEVASAGEAGYKTASLGRRILRMETAAIAASYAILYELG